MTSREFCYWLQGFFEIDDATSNHPGEEPLTGKQIAVIRKHLGLVFTHEIDPSYGDKKHQQKLNEIHSPLPAHMKPSSDGLARC